MVQVPRSINSIPREHRLRGSPVQVKSCSHQTPGRSRFLIQSIYFLQSFPCESRRVAWAGQLRGPMERKLKVARRHFLETVSFSSCKKTKTDRFLSIVESTIVEAMRLGLVCDPCQLVLHACNMFWFGYVQFSFFRFGCGPISVALLKQVEAVVSGSWRPGCPRTDFRGWGGWGSGGWRGNNERC